MRVERIGEATLYLGRCEDVLPDVSADHVITDPPYSGLVHNTRGRRGDDIRNDGGPALAGIGFQSIDGMQERIARHVCASCSGWFIVFSDIFALPEWRNAVLAAGGKSKSVCLWIKPDCAPQFNGQKPATAFECIGVFWCGASYSKWNGGGKRGLFVHNTNNPERSGAHETEKPVSLMCELVDLFSQPNHTILDPFMGSGTTGVACARLGRRFIGIELDEKHFETACRRIETAYRQPRLFAEPAPRPEQMALMP